MSLDRMTSPVFEEEIEDIDENGSEKGEDKRRSPVFKTETFMTPLERFFKAGKTIILLLRAVGLKPEKPVATHYNFLSWTVVYDEVLGISRLNYDKGSLTFDPKQYKANKESTVSQDIKDILRLPPDERTDAQIRSAVISLHNAVPSFAEFPLKVQRSMLKVCRYEKFEPGRVIMRQGQRAENFYFIIAGCAVVTEMDSEANHVTTANVLGKGNSFGELAFLNLSKRSATVTCREHVEVICIEREDFINIFMRGVKGREPDHVVFLKNVDLLKGWPIQVLPYDNPNIFAFTYVRRGVILCHDSAKCEWLFVVVSGSCKVLKSLVDEPARKLSGKQPRTHSVAISSTNSNFSHLHNADLPSSHSTRSSNQSLGLQNQTRARRYGQVSSAPTLAQGDRMKLKDRKLHDNLLSQIEHLAEINEIYYQKHVLPSIKKGEESEENTPRKTSTQRLQAAQNTKLFRPKRQSYGLQPPALPHVEETARAQSEARHHPKEKVFIELTRLEPGDVFGLEHVVLKGMRDVTSCSLVSDGAEVVLISKKFFQKHLTEDTMKEIRKKIRPLPSEKALQKNYETKKTWDVYKANTVAQHSSRRDRLNVSLQTG